MRGKLSKFISLFAGMLLLISCGDVNGGADNKSKDKIDISSIEAKYPTYFKNDGETVQTDVLKVAIVSDSPFKGIIFIF